MASLLERQSALNIIRAKIIRHLYSLADLIPPVTPFTHYNPQSSSDTKNAVDLLTKLGPDSHYVTGMAFALVMNPVPSNAEMKISLETYFDEKEEGDLLLEV